MTEIIGTASKDHPLTELPYPSSYKVITQRIYSDKTKRDVKGDMHTDRITVKRQVIMSWNLLSPEKFKELCDLTESDDLEVVCYDPQIRDFYSGGTFYRDQSFDYSVIGPWGKEPDSVVVSKMILVEK